MEVYVWGVLLKWIFAAVLLVLVVLAVIAIERAITGARGTPGKKPGGIAKHRAGV